MSIKNLLLSDIKDIQALIKEKAALLAKVAKIDLSLESYEAVGGGEVPTPSVRSVRLGRRPGVKVKGKRRGKKFGYLKEEIVKAVKFAGTEGVTIKELAAKLKTNYPNIATWFHSTGKKFKEIKKIGPGRYHWKEKAPVIVSAKPSKPVKSVKPTKPKKATKAQKPKDTSVPVDAL